MVKLLVDVVWLTAEHRLAVVLLGIAAAAGAASQKYDQGFLTARVSSAGTHAGAPVCCWGG